jgi:hypothetical protein
MGNMEQDVNQWWHPVASCISWDMMHWAMHFVLPWRTATAIKMASGGGGLFPIINFLP